MNNNEAIALLESAADRADAMLEMAMLTATDARAIVRLLKKEEEIENLKQTAQSVMEGICLLKEQEAVPVIQREVMHMLIWCCGSCGIAITDGDKFCRNCGRRMKWK